MYGACVVGLDDGIDVTTVYLKHESGLCSLRLQLTICDGFFTRFLGALPAGGIEEDHGLLFPDCRQIHTWFMRRPIAVLTFDPAGRVLSYHSSIPPFRIMPYETRGQGLLEMAPGRLDSLWDDLEGLRYLRLDPSEADRAGLASLARRGESFDSGTSD